MFEIPGAIQTLLKDMQAAGDDRPTGQFFVTGSPVGNLLDPTVWSTWRTFVGPSPVRTWGNMEETNDGRAIISYIENGCAYLAYASSVAEVLSGATTFSPGILLNNDVPYGHSSLKMIDGKLRMVLSRWNSETLKLSCHYWCDTDGNGTGFAYVSPIALDMKNGSVSANDPSIGYTGPIQKISTNCWVVMTKRNRYVYSKDQLFYSTNQGETWTGGPETPGWLGAHLSGASYCFLPIDDTSFWGAWQASDGSHRALLFTNSGATLESPAWVGWPGGFSPAPRCVAFIDMGINKDKYLAYNVGYDNVILRFIPEVVDTTNVLDYANWEHLVDVPDDAGSEIMPIFTLTNSALIMQHSRNIQISGAGILIPRVPIPIKSIVVDRSKGGASQAVVVIDNKDGVYAPDSTGIWWHVLWFNKPIQITLGYGTEQRLVFTGLIDTIRMSTYPPELTIKARDYSKLALDQMPQNDYYEGYAGVPIYAFTYYNKSPEYIFGDMATQAGWATGTVHVEVSAVTIPQFDTGHEKIADAFQRLAELTGWEWFTDEVGDLYFRPARDPSAVSVYSFTEGVDIFSLEYELDDEELYRTIVVWSGDENRDVIKSSGVWPAADYNNVLAKKTMIVNASDIVTDQAGADAMVLAISNGITPKVRNVDFVVVGNPYLQIGDLIQVTETTTWISEYYRITEISHQLNSTGSPIFGTGLKCFHFASEG